MGLLIINSFLATLTHQHGTGHPGRIKPGASMATDTDSADRALSGSTDCTGALHNPLHQVLAEYGIDGAAAIIRPFGAGLINTTWKVESRCALGDEFILQRVNEQVFPRPDTIHSNVRLISSYLEANAPDYQLVTPLVSLSGRSLVSRTGSSNVLYYRLFPFVKGSHSKDVITDARQAFEAAAQFGKFSRVLSNFEACSLAITLPSFHDLCLRYHQFLTALDNGNSVRVKEASELISFLISHSGIVDKYESIISNPSFKQRVMHHDTKISNVLFDEKDVAICVIDLDTVMPGYFISDVGDMMRTYLPTVGEEESDLTKIDVREDVYRAIVDGYLSEMEAVLSPEESKHFFFAGTFMVYMQALRFLTDHINDDVYYGAKYPGQNFIRASNQAALLQRLYDKEVSLQ
jgi:Ser/Thr protein kinase RdoA (MazF antagonist)